MRQCKFIKPLLLREPPDPTSFRPRDLELAARPRVPPEPARLRAHLRHAALLDHERGRFPRRVLRERDRQGALCRQLDHRHRARAALARHGLRAAAPLHGRDRRHRRRLGLCARRHGRGHRGAGGVAAGERRDDPHRRRDRPDPRARRARRRRRAARWRGDPRAAGAVEHGRQAHLSRIGRRSRNCPASSCSRCATSRSAGRRASSTSRSTGLPVFPAIPAGAPCSRGDMHVTDTHRDDGARLRRLEGGHLVARALHRHADPVADRPDHGARRQALHVGLRAVLPVRARERPVGRGRSARPSATP